jgi:hypothetical protein
LGSFAISLLINGVDGATCIAFAPCCPSRFVANFACSFLDRQQGEEQEDVRDAADGAAAAAASDDDSEPGAQTGDFIQDAPRRELRLLEEYCFGRAH